MDHPPFTDLLKEGPKGLTPDPAFPSGVSGILDSITDGFQAIGADYRFQYFNEAARRTFIEQGTNPDELIGRHIFDEVFPAERNQPWADALRRTMVERASTEVETFYEPWQRWFVTRYYPAPDGGVSVFFLDITERKRAEEALRMSEERLRKIFEYSNDAIFVLDPERDVICQANPKACEMFGYGRDEILATPISRFHPSDLAEFQKFVQGVFAEGQGWTNEFACRAKDGRFVSSEISASTIFVDDRTCILALVRDITERKQAEQQLRRSEQELAGIFNQTTAGIAQTDLTGRFTLVNERYCRMVGRSTEELYRLRMQDITHPDDLTANLGFFDTLTREGTPFAIEKRYIRPDGSHLWVRNSVSALKDEHGKTVHLLAASVDITERKRAEALVECQKQSLEMVVNGTPLEGNGGILNYLACSMESQLKGDGGAAGAAVAIHLMEADGYHFGYVAAPSLPAEYAQATNGLDARLELGCCSSAVMSHQATIVRDFAVETRWSAFTAEIDKLGLRSCFTTPILSPESNVLGTFAIYYREPRDPSPHDRELVDIVTRTVALAIERKRAEENVLYQKRLLEALTESVLDGILIVSPEGRMLHFNQRFLDIWRFPPEVVQSRSDEAALQWAAGQTADPVGFRKRVATVYEKMDEQVREELRMKDGRVYERWGSPIHSGEACMGWVWTFRDITEHKQAEEALRRSEERFARFMQHLPGLAWIKDPVGRYVFVNDATERAFGMPKEGLYGKTDEEVFPVDTARQFRENDRKVLVTGMPLTAIETLDQVDGRHHSLVHKFPMPAHEEGAIMIGGMAIDVTERLRMEDALRESEGKLREFAGGLERLVDQRTQELVQSQDRLRTLATELNLAEQRERKRLATELHDHLQQTLVLGKLTVGQGKRVAAEVPACQQILKKVDDIFSDSLTYTRTLVSDLSPTVLRDHGLAAALQWLGAYMQKYNQTVTVTVPDDEDLKLPEDQVILLFQSVRELLINSSKHAGTGQAKVTMEQRDGLLRIDVRDEGAGFDLAAAAAAAAGTPSGGISSKFGLFSIRERMRALGGSFELESAPGKGTAATLTLPLAGQVERDERDMRETRDKRDVGEPVSLLSPVSRDSQHAMIRVLLVDDHPMMRQGLRSIVTVHDHFEIVGEAGDGAEAVELAQRLNPDVVVMDINMPKMNGIEATQQIKANQPATVVIGLSVNQSADTERKMKAAGAFTYLTKESAADALCHAIEQAMSYKQHQAARPVD